MATGCHYQQSVDESSGELAHQHNGVETGHGVEQRTKQQSAARPMNKSSSDDDDDDYVENRQQQRRATHRPGNRIGLETLMGELLR